MSFLKNNQSKRVVSRSVVAFTLVELLVVLIIISILITLLYTVIVKAKVQSERAQARSEIAALESAIMSYRTENGFFPCQTQGVHDAFYLSDNMRVVACLAAADPRARVHLRVPTNVLGQSAYYDPFGFPYAIAMDEDGDGFISGLHYTNRPELANMQYTNRLDSNMVYSLTMNWPMSNNVRVAARAAVFSTMNIGATNSDPNSITLRSWK